VKAKNKKYRGVIVPMVTPFTKELSVDLEATKRILDTFLEAGVSPFLLGTTGESVSIADSQKISLVKSTVEYVNHRVKVYAGVSGNCLNESIGSAEVFAHLGVDAVVAHLPFYYPMDSTQMLRYFEQLADKIACPLILYNMPATTKLSIPLDVIDKLSYHPNIAGVKDSERGMERLGQSLKLWSEREDFVFLLGWAAQSAYSLLNGADGIVPSTGNITPKLYKDLYESVIQGNSEKANELQEKTNLVSEIYQKDRNLSQSIPALKVMMSVFGLCETSVMPPFYELGDQEKVLIKEKTIRELNEILSVPVK
jgi:dihydrodipicolinate synthase/N-acetylneuraminate lyase